MRIIILLEAFGRLKETVGQTDQGKQHKYRTALHMSKMVSITPFLKSDF